MIVRTRSIAVRLLPCAPGGMFHRATDEPEHLSHYGQPLHRPRSTEITSAPIGVRTDSPQHRNIRPPSSESNLPNRNSALPGMPAATIGRDGLLSPSSELEPWS